MNWIFKQVLFWRRDSLSSCVSDELLGSVGSSSSLVMSNEERFPRLVAGGGIMWLTDSDRLSPASSRFWCSGLAGWEERVTGEVSMRSEKDITPRSCDVERPRLSRHWLEGETSAEWRSKCSSLQLIDTLARNQVWMTNYHSSSF